MAFPYPLSQQSAPPAAGLYDPAHEHDACGVAFVADLYGRRSHSVVANGLGALLRLDHRGARGAEHNTGDGAGIMIQVPDAFLREVVDFPLPPAGEYATGLVFLPTDDDAEARARRVLEKYALVEGAEVLGWRDVPTDPSGLGETALAAMPGCGRSSWPQPAHRHPRRPGRLAAVRPRPGPGGVLRPQAGRAGDRRAGRAGLLPVAVLPDDGVQGDAHPRPAPRVLPRPDRRAGRQRHRAGALPVLHQHVPVVAAGPPVPDHRPQR